MLSALKNLVSPKKGSLVFRAPPNGETPHPRKLVLLASVSNLDQKRVPNSGYLILERSCNSTFQVYTWDIQQIF